MPRKQTLAIISALGEVGDALQAIDNLNREDTVDDVWSTLHDTKNALERITNRLIEALETYSL